MSLGQCNVPELPPGRRYVGAAAGQRHTLLLKDNGEVIAFGCNKYGQCEVPPLPQGLNYADLAAGDQHSVLVREDGQAFSFGYDGDGRCSVPELPQGVRYGKLLVSIEGRLQPEGDLEISCSGASGEDLGGWRFELDDPWKDFLEKLSHNLNMPTWLMRLINHRSGFPLEVPDENTALVDVFIPDFPA